MSYLENLRKIETGKSEYAGDNVVDLSAFDNAYEPGTKVREALKSYNTTQLSKSPDHHLKALKQALAKKEEVNPNQIEIANGLSDMLMMISMACFNNSKEVMLPEYTCTAHKNIVELLNLKSKKVKLDANFNINPEDFKDNGGILLKNPNITSNALSLKDIETVLSNNKDVIVVVDEMYIGFGSESCVSLITTYPNLVVVKSMKVERALSGINVAYCISSKDVTAAISGVKSLMNASSIPTLSNVIALASLEDDEYLLKNVRMITKTKDYVIEEVKKMGFEVLPSNTNFLVVKHKKTPAQKISDKLLKRNYKVKVLSDTLEGYFAFSISTQDVMNAFLKELKHAA